MVLSDEHEWKNTLTRYNLLSSIPEYRKDYMSQKEAEDFLNEGKEDTDNKDTDKKNSRSY